MRIVMAALITTFLAGAANAQNMPGKGGKGRKRATKCQTAKSRTAKEKELSMMPTNLYLDSFLSPRTNTIHGGARARAGHTRRIVGWARRSMPTEVTAAWGWREKRLCVSISGIDLALVLNRRRMCRAPCERRAAATGDATTARRQATRRTRRHRLQDHKASWRSGGITGACHPRCPMGRLGFLHKK